MGGWGQSRATMRGPGPALALKRQSRTARPAEGVLGHAIQAGRVRERGCPPDCERDVDLWVGGGRDGVSGVTLAA